MVRELDRAGYRKIIFLAGGQDMRKLSKSDLITIVEIARLCCGYVPEDLCEDLDISDEEFIRIRNVINFLGCNNYEYVKEGS
jgi:hypothetical protein